jgi:hypothetical protein
MKPVTKVAIALLLVSMVAADDAPRFKLVIGPETTRIMGPVLADGTVDYAEAFRAIASKGITADNNAGPLLQKAMAGWKKYGKDAREDQADELNRQQDAALKLPWKPAAFPEMDKWLDANEPELKRVEAASRKPRLYLAPPAGKDVPIGATEGLGILREMGMALAARALRHAGTGEQQQARNDIATAFRLGTLLGSEPKVLNALVVPAIDINALRAAIGAAHEADAADAQQWNTLLSALPERRINPDAFDVQNRFLALDDVMQILRGKTQKVLEEVTMLQVEPLFVEARNHGKIAPGDLERVDWNLVLRRLNDGYDHAAKIIADEDYRTRKAAWNALEEKHAGPVPGNAFGVLSGSLLEPEKGDVDERNAKLVKEVEAFLQVHPGESNDAFSTRIADYLLHTLLFQSNLIGSLDHVACNERIYRIAVALEAYRAAKGEYPAALKDLQPGYMPTVPDDFYAGQPFHYRRLENRYLLYSVGENGRDDRGIRSENADDVSYRGPA